MVQSPAGVWHPKAAAGSIYAPRLTQHVPGPAEFVGQPDTHISQWIPHRVQRMAMSSTADEIFFGGARGGGKSDWLVADFDKHADRYKSAAIGLLLRKTLGEFRPLLDKARKMFLGKAEYSVSGKVWTFRNGARLIMGYCDTMNDVSQYMGSEYTWMAFDELPEWPSMEVWEFLGSCMRSTEDIPKRRLATGNPGRPGHAAVKAYFVDIAPYGAMWKDPETGRTRQFIPSKLTENPHLMHNRDYVNQLKALDPVRRRAFLDGDWNVFLGQAFPEWDERLHVIPASTWVNPDWPKWASLDWGTNKPYAMLFWAATEDGHLWVVREAYGQKPDAKTMNVGTHESAASVAEREWANCVGTGCQTCIYDRSMANDQGHGFTLADQFGGHGWQMIPGIRNRLNGKAAVHNLLQAKAADGYPVLQVFRESCPHLIRTLPALPYATTGRNANEDVDSDAEDHPYDALQYSASSQHSNAMVRNSRPDYEIAAHADAQRAAWSVSDPGMMGKGWQNRR